MRTKVFMRTAMKRDILGSWLTSRFRVLALTALGTVFCSLLAVAYDSYSFSEGIWRLGPRPWNNVVIPLLVAPPFFYLLLSKLRALSVAHHRLEVVASTDSLTLCLNRAAFATLVEAYLERFDGDPEYGKGALLIIDVDHFKAVNDTYGHDCGDDALRLIAEAIRQNLRDRDLVGRLGGEEFCVFLPGASEMQSGQIAERIRQSVQEVEFQPDGKACALSVSIGGAAFCKTSSFSILYRVADQRLYAAKRAGRNQVTVGGVPSASLRPLQ
jgi:diguanylate cyclase